MITSYASLEIAVKATDDGAYDFIPKPFTPQELKASIDNITKQMFLRRITRKMKNEGKKIRYQFISILSHELKAPLNAIEGYLNILKEKKPGDNMEEYEQMIDRSLERVSGMRNLIMDLLDFTKIRLEKKKEKVKTVDLRNLAKDSISTVKPYAIQKNVSIKLDAEKDIKIEADPVDLEIIFNNLLSNAVKYNKNDGQVWLQIVKDEEKITIIVKDTGIGMTEEETSTLFKEFVRIKNDKTKNISGSGLGLSIVRKVAELYKGNIKVDSTPDKGTIFEVNLPLINHQTLLK
jgi:signal transduction histidine kinase